MATRALALGMLGLVALAVPAGAASTPDSTTTTTTKPAPSGSTTTTTVAPPKSEPTADTAAAPIAGGPRTAGPQELDQQGVRLPSDSLIAAMVELNLVRVRLAFVATHRAELGAAITSHERELTRLRAERDRERELRTEHAIAAYRGQSTGWQLGVITNQKLDDERALYLVAAAEAASRRKLHRLEARIGKLDRRLTGERSRRTEDDAELVDLVVRVQRLEAKLAESTGALALVAPPGSVITGPSPIALAADLAAFALQGALLSGKPFTNDEAWLRARAALAELLARSRAKADDERATATMIAAEWDATPPAVLRVVLFALRQVGKPYVYATAGPDTFDCSGLTKRAYAEIGLGLPHFSGAQLTLGIPVLPVALRPGDLLAYGPDGSAHVTMYVGGGVVVAAKGVAYGVVVGPARTDPEKGFAGATRVVP